MDYLLHNWQSYAKAYINDVILYFKTFAKHVAHFCKIFTLFTSHNINNKSIKILVGYTKIDLLS